MIKPPRLAMLIVSILAPKTYRHDILGDLQEDYHDRSLISRNHARRWYWAQVLRSIPAFCLQRLQYIGLTRIGLVLLAYVTAFFTLMMWDIHISRNVVQSFAIGDNPPDLQVIRRIYFLMFSLGAFIVGFMAAFIGFKPGHTFRRNVLVCLAPVFLTLIVLMLYNMVSSGAYARLTYVFFRSAMLALTLTCGAYVYSRIYTALNSAKSIKR